MTMWQIEVPMIITSEPGWVTVQAGTATCASTLPTETGVPSFEPHFPRPVCGQAPRLLAERVKVCPPPWSR